MIFINILFVLALGIVLHSFVAGIIRSEYTLTRGRSIIGLICMIYLSAYGLFLHQQVIFFSYGSKENFQDFLNFIFELF